MKLFAAALAITAFLVGPARAAGDMPPPNVAPPAISEIGAGEAVCEAEKGGRCMLNRDDLEKMHAMLERATVLLRGQAAALQQLREENDKLRAIKGCAKVTPQRT